MFDILKSLDWTLIIILAVIVIGFWIWFFRVPVNDTQRKKFWKVAAWLVTAGWVLVVAYSVYTNWPSDQTATFDASGQLRSK